MIHRSVSAGIRACFVAILIAMPAMMIPGTTADTAQVVALVSLIAGLLTYAEYAGQNSSFVDFRNAPPVNRVRFGAILIGMWALVELQTGGQAHELRGPLAWLSTEFAPAGRVMALFSSPSDLMVAQASWACAIAFGSVGLFAVIARFFDWPLNNGAFNVLTNLPLFDPTSGGDVLVRLRRDAAVNAVLGISLPYLAPALLGLLAPGFGDTALATPQTFVWAIAIWAFLPSSLLIRAIALWRVCLLIQEKRRRAYAQGVSADYLQAA